MTDCALGLWRRSGAVTQQHVDAANELYSKGRERGSWLLWDLTGAVCRAQDALPPMFLWSLAERDRREGRDSSRVFVRMVTNILLHLAAVGRRRVHGRGAVHHRRLRPPGRRL